MINTNQFATSITVDIPQGSIGNLQIGLASSTSDLVTTAVITTSTTAYSDVSSISFTPKKTGKLKVSAILFVNNDTAGDGVSCQLAAGTATYGTEALLSSAASQVQAWAFDGIVVGTVGTAITISTQIEAVTGGSASAVGNLVVQELLA